MSDSISSSTLDKIQLEASTIPSKWLLSGDPETRSKLLGKTADRLAYIMLWECGTVSYRWHYSQDEAYIVLSGEGIMTDVSGVEHRYGPGDVAFFPAGTDSMWRHDSHFRKVAVLKDPVWWPFAFASKALMKVLRMVGIGDRSPF